MKSKRYGLMLIVIVSALVVGLSGGFGFPLSTAAVDQEREGSAGGMEDQEKQTATMEAIEKLGACVEQYILDYRFVGAPKTEDLDELHDIFLQNEILVSKRYIKDAWGNRFEYRCDPTLGSGIYTITSYGADGKPGPRPVKRGVVRRFEEDLIWANGAWVQKPEDH